MATFYKDTLHYYDLFGRTPMSKNLLIDNGARHIRSSDANQTRAAAWTPKRVPHNAFSNSAEFEEMIHKLNSTFHCYKLDRQMPLWWLAENLLGDFLANRDSEIEKGQGRVASNYIYKEMAYFYLANKGSIPEDRLIVPDVEDRKKP